MSVVYSSLGPKHRLTAWAQLLALSTCRPDRSWQAVTLGRGSGRDKDVCSRSTIRPVPHPTARTLLLDLVALYRSGLETPLPMPCKTAEAYAGQRRRGRRPNSARAVAGQAWADGNQVPGEQSDPEHVLLRGAVVAFDELLGEPATERDLVDGWPADEEGDRFGVLARRVWEPLLRYEDRETL